MTTPQTQLRLRIYGSPQLSVKSLLEDLAESCRVVVRAIAQNGQPTTFSVSSLAQPTALEIELSGPLNAVQCWLKQLQKYPITIQGKGHASGDSWHY
ncbi:hypothetical protein IQ265_27015 [Nodosilinea sp. LEGE 06152]|uniref:hypothetical protein n=1 Tax=Nodosilinea sp. LEGE 06152 TaxID=2777966 RepID=UPI00188075DF|nr:hypothetical protein [Nodosilinea sp. LEGE 06152]MBE9160445.1 hypothetical protein [Nodosilinea sp. LEGE 06152]